LRERAAERGVIVLRREERVVVRRIEGEERRDGRQDGRQAGSHRLRGGEAEAFLMAARAEEDVAGGDEADHLPRVETDVELAGQLDRLAVRGRPLRDADQVELR